MPLLKYQLHQVCYVPKVKNRSLLLGEIYGHNAP